MTSVDYCSKVIKVVAELMEVREEDILGKSRVQEVVDARWMVIVLMKEKGYSTKQIAPLMCHPIRTVNHALSCFSDRAKYSFNNLGNTLATARQLLL
jgi:chromosomal replication initiation ATPase DnaA